MFSGDLGTLSLGIPYHTCNATKVARETTAFFFFSKLKHSFPRIFMNSNWKHVPCLVCRVSMLQCLKDVRM